MFLHIMDGFYVIYCFRANADDSDLMLISEGNDQCDADITCAQENLFERIFELCTVRSLVTRNKHLNFGALLHCSEIVQNKCSRPPSAQILFVGDVLNKMALSLYWDPTSAHSEHRQDKSH